MSIVNSLKGAPARLAFLACFGLYAALAGTAPALAGPVRVVDGDTIVVDGVTVRLEGIDAPEMAQTCQDGLGATYRCGVAARDFLAGLTQGLPVRCDGQEEDAYERRLATCFAGSLNINQAMVENGQAYAFVRYSRRYEQHEAEARRTRRGLWAGTATPPWDFRAGKWQTAGNTAPAGCPIKGNISRNGRIYHTPWSPHYARTRINEAAGERWFCSEQDAIAAGWRAPLN